jgi:uncharacterized Zn-binding protein involved in type VI secretion
MAALGPTLAASAARVSDPVGHVPGAATGAVAPPGVVNVTIEGLPAAVAGGMAACSFVQTGTNPDGPQPLQGGSASVKISGAPALRAGVLALAAGDKAACGAFVLSGAQRVVIGG